MDECTGDYPYDKQCVAHDSLKFCHPVDYCVKTWSAWLIYMPHDLIIGINTPLLVRENAEIFNAILNSDKTKIAGVHMKRLDVLKNLYLKTSNNSDPDNWISDELFGRALGIFKNKKELALHIANCYGISIHSDGSGHLEPFNIMLNGFTLRIDKRLYWYFYSNFNRVANNEKHYVDQFVHDREFIKLINDSNLKSHITRSISTLQMKFTSYLPVIKWNPEFYKYIVGIPFSASW